MGSYRDRLHSFKLNLGISKTKLLYGFKPWNALVVLIILNLIFGVLLGNQYGQTWDEPSFYLYGERSWDAYMRGLAGQPLIPEKHIYFLDLRYYGAFYTAIGWKVVELLKPILKNWGYMDVWHFVNFLFFQIALISLYFLAKRYFSSWLALLVVFLFGTQPLIFGHAFINPKDIPFMTFFMASVTFGLYMVDAVKKGNFNEKKQKTFPYFQLLLSLLFGLFVLTFTCKDVIYSFVAYLISSIYDAPVGTLGSTVFSLLVRSSSRLPVENYIHKAVSAHLERSFIYLMLFLLLWRKLYLNRLKGFVFGIDIDFRLLSLTILSGVVLGLATSIRLLAPFAGVLVVLYALGVRGRNSIPTLIYFFSIAALITYLTWPFLWSSPTYNFLEAFKVMKDFPFTAEVRFMGDNVSPSNLPWFYIPLLVSIQATMPVVLLAWVGFVVFLVKLDRQNMFENAIPLIWLILPVGLQIFLQSTAYDNFRQFLFILPPMFILAGKGIDVLIQRVANLAVKGACIVFCVLPGLVGIVLLHPVQYIYYNGFVGGVSGAEGNFELDYWLSSYREAGSYINKNASPNANILAWGSGYNGARSDLTIYSFSSESDIEEMSETFEYAVITTRFDSNMGVFRNSPVVYEIRKNGALLAVVKKLPR